MSVKSKNRSISFFWYCVALSVTIIIARNATARDDMGTVALKSAPETAEYVFPETSRALTGIVDEREPNPKAPLQGENKAIPKLIRAQGFVLSNIVFSPI